MNADENEPPYVRPARLIVAAGRYRRHGPGPWYAVAGGAVCLAFISRDGALWPAAGPGLSQTPADGLSGYGLGRLRRAGARDRGIVSVRGPARPHCDRALCSGHQPTGLDTVRILGPHTTLVVLTPWSRLCSLPRCQNPKPHGRPRLEKDTSAHSGPARSQSRAARTEKRGRPQGRRLQRAASPTGSRPVRMRLTVTAVLSSPFPTANSLSGNKP